MRRGTHGHTAAARCPAVCSSTCPSPSSLPVSVLPTLICCIASFSHSILPSLPQPPSLPMFFFAGRHVPEDVTELEGGRGRQPSSLSTLTFMSAENSHRSVPDGWAVPGGVDGCDATTMPMRPRVVAAVTNFLLTLYASLTAATMKMLYCVSVPGTQTGERRLFIQGSEVCSITSQAPYVTTTCRGGSPVASAGCVCQHKHCHRS